MKIVNIIQRYSPAVGGSETWCQEVCRHLSKKGHNVKVLTLNINKEEEYWREPLDDDRTIAFGPLAFDKGVLVRRYHRSIPAHYIYHLIYKIFLDWLLKIYFYGPHSTEMYGRMWREIKEADIVFLHTLPYPHNYVAYALAKIFGKKTVIVPHFHPNHPNYERRSQYWLLRRCNAVITVSEFEKDYLKDKGISENKLFVTGNAIHPNNYLPVDFESFREKIKNKYYLNGDDKVITYIGRKTPEKGVGYLIEAVKDILSEMHIKLFLVGPGSDWYREYYAGLSDEEKKHIIEMGILSHEEKVNLLHMSDLLVLPSKYEAFGIVFLEAWMCGVSVIGTTEGAMPSVIGEEGLISKFGDVEDLKEKLKEAFSNIEKLRKTGTRGKTKVLNNYTWNIIGEKTESAINTVYGSKKVLICTNAYPPRFIGGAELIAHNQAKSLKKQGYDVIVFAGKPDDNLKNRYSIRHDFYEGIPVYRVSLHPRDYSYEYFSFYHKEVHKPFDDLLETFSPDVVHFHNIVGLSVGLIEVAKRRKIKTVLTLHDYWGICHKNTLIKSEGIICNEFSKCESCQLFISGERWRGIPSRMRKDYISFQLQAIDTFISPSIYLSKMYVKAGINEEKIQIIPYGINVERFSNVYRKKNTDKLRFSFIGYLGEHKGINTILEALSFIKDKKNMILNFIGDGDKKNELEKITKETGLDNYVHFSGKINSSKIEDAYKNTDVLILPSIWPDNHPVSICEAMASRIPVIASRIGGIPELVEDGKTGYLFEAGNSRELANKMIEFISCRSKVKEFGDNGFKKISHYNLDKQVGRNAEVYKENKPSKVSLSQNDVLILCLGRDMNPEYAKAMDSYLKVSGDHYRALMIDWLDEDQIKKAKLLWIVDKDTNLEDIEVGLRNKVPLLAPENNQRMKNICVKGKCGLYYRDALEALVCLEYLTENESVRKAMGNNGFKVFYKGINNI